MVSPRGAQCLAPLHSIVVQDPALVSYLRLRDGESSAMPEGLRRGLRTPSHWSVQLSARFKLGSFLLI